MHRIDYVNWQETQREFGYESKKFKPIDKVIINCSACDCNIACTYGSIRLTKNGIPYSPICKSCQQKRTWETNEQFRNDVSKANSESMKKIWENPEYKENQSEKHVESTRKMWENQEYRDAVSNSIKAKHRDSEDYTNKTSRFIRTPELKEKMKETATQLWQNPEYRSKIVHGSINNWKKNREKLLAIFRSKEYIDKSVIIAKKLWKNPEYAQKCLNNHSSKLEEHLAELLTNLNIEFDRQHHLGHWSFDFMIKRNDGKKILIEVQGEYWHFKRFNNTDSPRDKAKATYVERYHSNEYILKTIWENEFLSPERLQNRLNEILGVENKVHDFDIKKCTVGVADNDLASKFFSKYHYSASGGRGGITIGCYLDDVLIGCCKYCSPTRKESAERLGLKSSELRELTKFCIHPNYQKKNLATWFISRTYSFLPEQTRCLLSFSDETFGHNGTIYRASNWEHNGEIDPDYVYVDSLGFIIHKKTLWNQASRMSMKESEYADLWGFTKMWGNKKHRFLKWIKK